VWARPNKNPRQRALTSSLHRKSAHLSCLEVNVWVEDLCDETRLGGLKWVGFRDMQLNLECSSFVGSTFRSATSLKSGYAGVLLTSSGVFVDLFWALAPPPKCVKKQTFCSVPKSMRRPACHQQKNDAPQHAGCPRHWHNRDTAHPMRSAVQLYKLSCADSLMSLSLHTLASLYSLNKRADISAAYRYSSQQKLGFLFQGVNANIKCSPRFKQIFRSKYHHIHQLCRKSLRVPVGVRLGQNFPEKSPF
jgi:hypothetical protein